MIDGTPGITPTILLEKLREFVKSVLPVDVGQTALLFGAVLMLGIRHMHSWATWLERLARAEGAGAAIHASTLLTYPLYLIYIAGAVALWIGLNEVLNPQRWLRLGVFAPFWIGLIVNLLLGWHYQNRYAELPLVAGSTLTESRTASEVAARLPGLTFTVALFAWLMVLIAYKRLGAGEMTVPVRFPSVESDHPGAARATARVIWCALVLTSLVALILNALIETSFVGVSSLVSAQTLEWLKVAAWDVGWAIAFAAIIWFACGSERLSTFSRSMRIPETKWVGLSIFFPLAVCSAGPLGEFFIYRIRGPASYAANYSSNLSDHFPAFQLFSLLAIASALSEEIAWRGYLQPKFISRFGMYRGIFLVCMVWGTFHFPWDFSGRGRIWWFAVGIASRLINAIATGFVFSWLTLRAKSVIPAAIAHGVMNALYHMKWNGDASEWAIYGLWGVLAFVLFKFWPPVIEDESITAAPPDDELQGSAGVLEGPA